ncbi:MAG TPA: acyl-CoA dehydrogenase family protein [Solirubrobacteraceae bacterium]|nr:acyl-CoA dehydrogenase family protein [Solirubrobacteraceae bacterium]
MSDWLLIDGARRLLGDVCTYEAVQAAEAEGWSSAVWDAVDGAGYASLSELPLEDAVGLLTVAGEHAAPVPLAEAALAGWLLGEPPPGRVSVAPAGDLRLEDGVLSGAALRVPWGHAVERIVAVVDTWAVVVPVASAARVERRTNLAGEPRDTLVFERAAPHDVRPVACELLERGALTRAALIAGALAAMARLTVAYAQERRQFGRPIAAFQAVQAHLVSIAQDASLVGAAVDGAAHRPGSFEIAAAKALASRAALSATRAAHQVHGAMGMTQEYRLHHFSRRLWAWRNEYGDERHWAAALGEAVVAAGPDELYPAITGGSAVI